MALSGPERLDFFQKMTLAEENPASFSMRRLGTKAGRNVKARGPSFIEIQRGLFGVSINARNIRIAEITVGDSLWCQDIRRGEFVFGEGSSTAKPLSKLPTSSSVPTRCGPDRNRCTAALDFLRLAAVLRSGNDARAVRDQHRTYPRIFMERMELVLTPANSDRRIAIFTTQGSIPISSRAI